MRATTFDRRRNRRPSGDGERKQRAGVLPAATELFDVFVCYSRRDSEFVERINRALAEAGKAAYVDWRIPDWSPDYESELVGAIDASNTFLFVLSPDSVASPYCKRELDRAVEQGKRIKPLLLRDVDDGAVPEPLRRPQWIDFRRADSFAHASARLLAAVDVDADWVHAHTRIGVRAGEWDRNGWDASFLLRGRDLRDAEAWLAEQTGKEPSPTELHVRYVLASRRAAVRRHRALVSAVSTALVVAIGLGLFALLQRNQAIVQRDEATSRGLAAQVLVDLDGGELDRAVLLSMEALRTRSTFDARSAAVTVLERSDRIETLLRSQSRTSLDALAVSPDGRLVAAGGLDREIRVWDVVTRRPYCPPLRLPTLDEPVSLSFGPRGRQLVAGYNGSNTTIWSLSPSGAVAVPLQGRAGYAWSAALSPDGRAVATAGFDGEIDIWNARNGVHLERLRDARDSFPQAEVAFVSSRALADYTDGVLTVRNWRTGRVMARRRLPGLPLFEAFSVDSDRFATFDGGRYTVWDVRSQRRVGAVNRDTPGSVALGPGGRRLALLGANGEITVWDVRTGEQRGLPLIGDTRADLLAFGWDGSRIVTSGDGLVTVWRLAAESRLSRVLAGDARHELDIGEQSLAGALAFDRGRRRRLVWANDDGLIAWDLSTSRIIGTRTLSGDSVNSFAISPDGRRVAVADYDRVQIWRFGRRAPLVTLPLGATALAFSPDGRLLATGAAAADGSVRLWDPHTGAQLGKAVRASREVIWDVAFDPAGTTVAAVGYGDVVSRWSVEGAGGDRPRLVPAKPNRLRGHSGAVNAAAFSPDSRLLATGDHGGTIRLWNAATGRPLGEPLAAGSSITDLSFDPGSAILASADADGEIRFWDIQNSRELGGPLRAHLDAVTSLAFHADGEMLASTDINKAVVLWDPILWKSDWSRVAHRLCPILSRNLTRAEWAQFLPDQPYHATCDQAPIPR